MTEEREGKTKEMEIEVACKNYYDFNEIFSEEWAAFETRIEDFNSNSRWQFLY
ncbi:MAG: hypothetical protein WEF53_07340 [Bacteroidota bacterium]